MISNSHKGALRASGDHSRFGCPPADPDSEGPESHGQYYGLPEVGFLKVAF